MRKISIPRPIETIEIEIGDVTIPVRFEVTNIWRLRFGKIFTDVGNKLREPQKLYDAALERGDAIELGRQADAMAAILEPAMKEFLGEEKYQEIIVACDCGGKISGGACTEVFTPLIKAVAEILAEHNAMNEVRNDKTAHHPAEVPDALQQTDLD